MGTLQNQTPRNYKNLNPNDIEFLTEDLIKISKKYKLDIVHVIKIYEILEYQRRTSIMVADGDAKDEQLSGFGKLCEDLINSIKSLKK